MCPNSDFYHFEVLLPGAAFRTSPVHRDILPTRPGRDPLLWEACRFVIDEAADQTHPGFEILLFRHQVGIGYNGPSHHNLSDEPPASYRRFFAAHVRFRPPPYRAGHSRGRSDWWRGSASRSADTRLDGLSRALGDHGNHCPGHGRRRELASDRFRLGGGPSALGARGQAGRLVQGEGEDDDELALPSAAEKLLGLGCEYVLITGTHENTPQVVNTLYGPEGVVRSDSWERLPGSYHGSGCTLAAAIAATLANGLELPEAVREAQEYTWQTLNAGFRPGMGQYIPDRFFWAREMDEPGTGKA